VTSSGSVPSDDRYVVVDGRRWRATDPAIPEGLRRELVAELMAARRAVRSAGDDDGAVAAARRRVHDAKVALGERGVPWWEPPDGDARRVRIAATARALLRHREPGSTICPSDVARTVGGSTWRPTMEAVRAVAAELASTGELVVLQQAEPVADLSTVRGPVRYGRGSRFPHPPP
jgi:hypothetical protein